MINKRGVLISKGRFHCIYMPEADTGWDTLRFGIGVVKINGTCTWCSWIWGDAPPVMLDYCDLTQLAIIL